MNDPGDYRAPSDREDAAWIEQLDLIPDYASSAAHNGMLIAEAYQQEGLSAEPADERRTESIL